MSLLTPNPAPWDQHLPFVLLGAVGLIAMVLTCAMPPSIERPFGE